MKKSFFERLDKVAAEQAIVHAVDGRAILTPKQIAYALIAVAVIYAERGGTQPAHLLANYLFAVCRDRDLAHAAVDDAFDAARRTERERQKRGKG